jgi:hypothetical protein
MNRNRYNAVTARCQFCSAPATRVWRMRNQLAHCQRQRTVYLATCEAHADTVNYYASRNPERVR